jgi:hypothetical protein
MSHPAETTPSLRRPAPITAMILVAAWLISGCSTAPRDQRATNPARDTQTFYVRYRDTRGYSQVLDAPVERVWAALPQAFADLNYKAGPSAREGERLYLTPHMTIPNILYPGFPNSAFLDCGRTATNTHAADEYSVTFAILAWASPHPSGTMVEILIDGLAVQRGMSSNKVSCAGTGRLERDLLQALQTRLGARSGGR